MNATGKRGPMIDPILSGTKKRHAAALLAILLLLLAAYGNTFQASWHMDDYPNILNNPAVQITNLDIRSLSRAVGIDQTHGNNLSRPVANLSFALNWFLHGANVAGFHLVNLMIHLGNTALLYWIVGMLGATPCFPERYRTCIPSIAIGASFLWAIHPIQTQAVTYIVQRMASLSALFYFAALAAYIKLRLVPERRFKIYYGAGVGFAFLLALGAKENAITLPLALALVEWIFFQKGAGPLTNRRLGLAIVAGVVSTLLFVILFFYITERDMVQTLTRSFEIRPFSLLERVLTQPRVVIFYLSLLLYPIPQRFSLEHDFVLSTSIWHPWTTLPAMLLIGSLIAVGIWQARKRPLLAFALLFFFLNHAVESSILPLEMVFEHRNYLPSAFVFLPIAAGWQDLQNGFRLKNRDFNSILKVFPILVVVLLGAGTFIRNLDWQDERTLWSDAHRKAPGRTRPVFNLAKDLERRGQYEQAIVLYGKSISLQPPRLKHFDIMALTNIGTILYRTGNYEKAIEYYRKALDILPETRRSHYNLAVAYTRTGRFEQAQDHLVWLIQNNANDTLALDLLGVVHLKQHQWEEALNISRRLLQISPDNRTPNLQIGAAFTQMGLPAKGAWFLRRAKYADPGNMVVMLCMLENRLSAGDLAKADEIRSYIFHRYSLGAIDAALSDTVNEIGRPEILVAYIEKSIRLMGMNN